MKLLFHIWNIKYFIFNEHINQIIFKNLNYYICHSSRPLVSCKNVQGNMPCYDKGRSPNLMTNNNKIKYVYKN